MEEQDKGQRADLFAVIGQLLTQKPSALRRKDSPTHGRYTRVLP